MELDLETMRACYAEKVRVAGHLQTPGLGAAFGRVARERFLPPGPWRIASGRSEEWNARLRGAFGTRRWGDVRSIRRDAHAADETCFGHDEQFCLSMRPPAP